MVYVWILLGAGGEWVVRGGKYATRSPARCSLRAVVARHHVAGSLMVLRHGYGGTVADIGVQFVVDAMGC